MFKNFLFRLSTVKFFNCSLSSLYNCQYQQNFPQFSLYFPVLRNHAVDMDADVRNPRPIQNGVTHAINSGVRWLQQQMSGPRPVVICGPSGSGKSTLLKYLMEEFGDYFGFSISHTTRKPRPGEKPGKDYYFVDHAEMERSIANGEFLEFAAFSGNMYGTSKKSVKRIQDQRRICILDIEIEGVKNTKKTDLNARYIFIKPPSVKVLEERLRGRGTESEESIQKRLFKAKEELRYGETPGNFDIVLVNDDAEETYKQMKNFLLNDIEELKRRNDNSSGDH